MPITTGTTGDLKNFSLTCARAVIFLRLATSRLSESCALMLFSASFP